MLLPTLPNSPTVTALSIWKPDSSMTRTASPLRSVFADCAWTKITSFTAWREMEGRNELFLQLPNSVFCHLNRVRNMSETTEVTKKQKEDVAYILRAFTPKKDKVKTYQKLALELSKLVKKNPPWSWRYVQSVDHGTVEPSKKFMKAVRLLKKPRPKYERPEWLLKWYRLSKDERWKVIEDYLKGKQS
jgi:hypothetical protein